MDGQLAPRLTSIQKDGDESGSGVRAGSGAELLPRDVRPADGASGELHVTDQRLDGGLPHQAHEEELGDEAGGDSAQRRQAQQQPAKALRLRWVLHALVLRQRHLSLLLQ